MKKIIISFIAVSLMVLSGIALTHEVPAIPIVVEGGVVENPDRAIVIAVNGYIYKWIFIEDLVSLSVIDADACSADPSCIDMTIALRERHAVVMINLRKELTSPRTILVPQEITK